MNSRTPSEELRIAESVRYESLCRDAIESKNEFSYVIGLTQLRDLGFVVEEILSEEET